MRQIKSRDKLDKLIKGKIKNRRTHTVWEQTQGSIGENVCKENCENI